MLGREPLLSAAEIFSLLGASQKSSESNFVYTPPIARFTAIEASPEQLMGKLGGTIKIAEQIAAHLSETDLVQHITQAAKNIEGKITFGISAYANTTPLPVETWAKHIKHELKNEGRSVRYISGESGVLNSATVFHNDLCTSGREFLVLVEPDGTFSLAFTRAVQPLEELSNRDFGRPGRDSFSGMLPPKLAMMMINVGFGATAEDVTILDPFCGSGTILTEAMRLGFKHIIGCDISDKAVADSQRNIDWTVQSLNLQSEIATASAAAPAGFHLMAVKNLKLSKADVTQLTQQVPAASVDLVVTEPYMGPPLRGNESADQIKNTCAELATLYEKAFEQFAHVLKPNGVVIFSIPRFTTAPTSAPGVQRDTWFTISDRIIPKLKSLGFSKERLVPEELTPTSYILYHRPNQRVGREIWKFRFK